VDRENPGQLPDAQTIPATIYVIRKPGLFVGQVGDAVVKAKAKVSGEFAGRMRMEVSRRSFFLPLMRRFAPHYTRRRSLHKFTTTSETFVLFQNLWYDYVKIRSVDPKLGLDHRSGHRLKQQPDLAPRMAARRSLIR